LQPLLQHLGLQHFLQLNSRSIRQGLQHLVLQPQLLPQPLLQAGAMSAPQAGAEGAAQVGAAGAAQAGAAQAGAPQPVLQPLLQHLGLQQRLPSRPPRFNPQHFFLQQLLPQPLLQPAPAPQEGSAPQAGADGAAHVGPAGAAHVGAAGAAQLGAAGAEQAGAAQLGLQQLVWQPQPLAPSIRSSKSKPKLCVQSPKPSTIDPRIIFNFI
jgi:hypothetical protein